VVSGVGSPLWRAGCRAVRRVCSRAEGERVSGGGWDGDAGSGDCGAFYIERPRLGFGVDGGCLGVRTLCPRGSIGRHAWRSELRGADARLGQRVAAAASQGQNASTLLGFGVEGGDVGQALAGRVCVCAWAKGRRRCWASYSSWQRGPERRVGDYELARWAQATCGICAYIYISVRVMLAREHAPTQLVHPAGCRRVAVRALYVYTYIYMYRSMASFVVYRHISIYDRAGSWSRSISISDMLDTCCFTSRVPR